MMEMRKTYQKEFMAKHGIKLGLMSPFVRAAAYALQQNPTVNAGVLSFFLQGFSYLLFIK